MVKETQVQVTYLNFFTIIIIIIINKYYFVIKKGVCEISECPKIIYGPCCNHCAIMNIHEARHISSPIKSFSCSLVSWPHLGLCLGDISCSCLIITNHVNFHPFNYMYRYVYIYVLFYINKKFIYHRKQNNYQMNIHMFLYTSNSIKNVSVEMICGFFSLSLVSDWSYK